VPDNRPGTAAAGAGKPAGKKLAVITGAAGNLGRAVAAAFGREGHDIALVDVTDAALSAAYPQADDRQLLVAADLTDEQSTRDALASIHRHFGPVDCLCNIAGGFSMGPPVHETSAEFWKKMMDINVITLLNTVRAVVPGMLAAGSGCVVNVGAGGGVRGAARMAAYAAAKSAVMRVTESMSSELRDGGINVNCVLPGIIDTPQNRQDMPHADPAKWVATDDLASVILFLCSDRARAIHGASIPVTGLS
jgi:NAD(P)-dependent dehydrogenase (short-subunit alcohol dehydrogenase family)